MDASKKQREPVAFKSLAELKRFIRPGVEFKTVSHANHADIVGLTRVVTTVQTVGFYSKVKDQPEHPFSTCNHGKGFYTDFGKAGNYIFDGTTVKVELPASAEALREVQKQLGADGWEGAMVLDYDGIIPQAAEFADLPMELDAFNDFAEAVEAMPSREKQIPKLKALLEHFEVTDLATAAGLAEHIGDYILTPEISSPQEAAIDELNFTMDAHSAELLLPHVNLFTYGNEIIKDDNAALTSYGLLHRGDYQPMQTPVQERFEMDTQQLT